MTLNRNSTDINLFAMTFKTIFLSCHYTFIAKLERFERKKIQEYEGLTNLNYFSRKLTKIDLQNSNSGKNICIYCFTK